MAYCTEYENLDNEQQVEHIAKVIHALQKNSLCFILSEHIITNAETNGVYSGVKFGRDALLNEKTVHESENSNQLK